MKKAIVMRTVLFLLLLLVCRSYASVVNLTHLTVNDGLPNSTVYHAMQDRKGFIWFCTETGVCRYDGRRFEKFTINDGLADNEIFKAYEDKRGRIWFLSYNGKLSFYSGGKIYNSENTPRLAYPLTGGYLLRCVEDKGGTLWFSCSNDYVLRVSDSGVMPYAPEYHNRYYNDFSIDDALFIQNDSASKFLLNSDTKDLYIINLVSGVKQYICKRPEINNISKIRGRAFCDSKGMLLIADDNFVSYHGAGHWQALDLRHYGIKTRIFSFLLDKNWLWLATEGDGVVKIDLAADCVSLRLLDGEHVDNIMKDNEDNYWFVTHDNGIYALKRGAQFITTVNTQNTFSVQSVNYDDKHYVLSGDNNGIVYIILRGTVIRSVHTSQNKLNRIIDIIPTGGPNVIFGCDQGVYPYNIVYNKLDFKKYPMGYKNFDLVADGTIILCSHDRIRKYSKGSFTLLNSTLNQMKYTAIAGAGNEYYVGTTNKLYKASESDTLTKEVLGDSILKTQVTSLRSINGYLWVATHGNGVFLLKNDRIVAHMTKDETGIASDICQKLYDDKRRYVWLSTNEGLSMIDRNTFHVFFNLNVDAGLSSNDVKNVATDGDTVLVATAGGTNIFRLSDIQTRSEPPAVYVTSYHNGSEKVIDPGDHISFRYFTGFINIGFTAVSFGSPGNLEYEYKFEGEPEWHKTVATDIPFFSLVPGKHTLLFRARKYNSDWSKPALLFITVNPLWFQTRWFFIAMCGIGLLTIYYIVYLRLRAIRRKAHAEYEYKENIRQLENKALASQMNPHFIFNSLNTVQQLILVRDETQSLNFLSEFSILMRKMLENSRKQFITLSDEIEFLSRYLQLESIRFSGRFSYSIMVDKQLYPDDIKIPPALIQPLLENAIKHGISDIDEPGVISLCFEKRRDLLIATVEDNGVGISAHTKTTADDKRNKSTALKILEERLQLITNRKGERSRMYIKDRSIENPGLTGTIIELQIPI